jgi:hypothetical protein
MHASPVPPLLDLPALLGATDRIDRGRETNKDIALVLAPGTSLGGARPKASVRDKDGRLLVAKFPKRDDDWPVTRWEAVVLRLAAAAGIDVPQWRFETIAPRAVLLLGRFDREQAGGRIPYMSGMTALDATDYAISATISNSRTFYASKARSRRVNWHSCGAASCSIFSSPTPTITCATTVFPERSRRLASRPRLRHEFLSVRRTPARAFAGHRRAGRHRLP